MTNFEQYLTTKQVKSDEDYMAEALLAAERAKATNNLPVGAVLAMQTKQLAEHDTSVTDFMPLNTATVNVLYKAFDLMPRRVADAILYCTVEPSSLDVLNAHEVGINEIVFGCYNRRDGFVSSHKRPINLSNYGISCKGGVMATECYSILNEDLREVCSIVAPE